MPRLHHKPLCWCVMHGGDKADSAPYSSSQEAQLTKVSNYCQIPEAKMQLPPGSHLSHSALLPWEGTQAALGIWLWEEQVAGLLPRQARLF